jgi:lysophospholipase L1-like esterase
MAARLGWDLTADIVGASGYNAGSTFASRLAPLLASNAENLLIEGGANDANETFAADVASFLAAVRAGLPDATLYVVVTHRCSQFKADILHAAEAACLDWDDVAEIPRTGVTRWLTGTGDVGTPAGDGNRDVYLGSDGIHPTTAGYAYLGTRLAFAIRPPATGLDF